MTDNYNCSWCNEHAIPGMFSQSDVPGRFCSSKCRTAAVEEHLLREIKYYKELWRRRESRVESLAEMCEEKDQQNAALLKQWNDLDLRTEARHREWNEQLLEARAEIVTLKKQRASLRRSLEATAAPSVNFPPDHSPADIADQILNEEEENDE